MLYIRNTNYVHSPADIKKCQVTRQSGTLAPVDSLYPLSRRLFKHRFFAQTIFTLLDGTAKTPMVQKHSMPVKIDQKKLFDFMKTIDEETSARKTQFKVNVVVDDLVFTLYVAGISLVL